ncbi:MAG: NACHT domain-containing protein [Gammaproteobacteria bacterium]|nr:NACHT domain-containing protein [Gammaproteobacteria bacterium]
MEDKEPDHDVQLLNQSPKRVFDQQQSLMPHEIELLKNYGEIFLKKDAPKKVIFISYAWSLKSIEDNWDEQWTDQFVLTLADHLRLMGFECIVDRTHLGWGRSLGDAMNESVNKADHIILIITNTYVFKYNREQKSGVRIEMEYIEKRIESEGGIQKAGASKARLVMPMIFVEPQKVKNIPLIEGLEGFAGIYFDKRDYLDVLMEFPHKLYGIRDAPITKKFIYAGLEHALRIFQIDFKRQIRNDIRLRTDLDGYCYPDVVLSPDGSSRRPVLDMTNHFLKGKDNQSLVFLLQGESGAGKSTFVYKYADDLWAESTLKIQEEAFYIPLIIELRSYKKRNTLGKYIAKRFGFSEEEVGRLKQRCKFLLCLDGYDEYLRQYGEVSKPVLKDLFRDIQEWNLKVIVTCRSLYLTQDPSHKLLFSIQKNHNEVGVDECWLASFTEEQINHVVKKRCELQPSSMSAEECQDILKRTPHLFELCQLPLLLQMILTILPNLTTQELAEINRAGIYKKFISQWFEREGQRLLERLGQFPEQGFNSQEYFGFFAKELAFEMFLENVLSIEYVTAAKKTKPGRLKAEPEITQAQNKWARFFGEEISVVYKRNGCPLCCEAFTYSFYHKSFYEYFVARYFFENLGLDQEEETSFLEEFIRLSESDFNLKLIGSEPEITRFLAEMLPEKLQASARLRKIVGASKQHSQVAIAASNAVTVLVAAQVSLAEENLEKVNILQAQLTGAMLQNASLGGANLSGANLSLSTLNGVDCRGAILKDIEFGEQYILEDRNWGASAVWFDHTGRLMVAVPSDEEKRINIMDYSTHTQISYLSCEENVEVGSCCVTHDGSYLVWNIDRNMAQLRSLVDNKILGYFEGTVEAVAVSPNKRFLAFKGHYDETSILDFEKSKQIFEIRSSFEEEGNVLCADDSLVFSADNFYFASSAIHRGQIYVWKTSSFDEAMIILPNINGVQSNDEHGGEDIISVYGVAFNPRNNQLIAGYSSGNIVLWEIPSGNKLRCLSGAEQPIYSVKFSHAGDFFVSGGDDCKVKLWDSDTGNCLGLLLEFPGWVFQVRFNQQSTALAVEGEGNVTQVSIANRLRQMHKGHLLPVKSVCFSPDNQLVVSLGDDRCFFVWSVASCKVVAKIELEHVIEKIQFSKDGKKLYGIPELGALEVKRIDGVSCRALDIIVWDAQSWKKIEEIPITKLSDKICIEDFLVNTKNNMFVIEQDEGFIIKPFGKLGDPVFFGHSKEDSRQGVNAWTLSPDGCRLAIAYYKRNFIRLWAVPSKRETIISIDREKESDDELKSLMFSPSGQLLVGTTKKYSVFLMRVSRKQTEKKPFTHITLNNYIATESIVFSKNEKTMFIVVGGSISVWSIDGHCYSYIPTSANGIDVNFSVGRLSSAGNDHAVMLWEISPEYTLKPIFTSRPMFSCVGAIFSQECDLSLAQRMLVEERGGVFHPPIDNLTRTLLPIEESFYFHAGRELFKWLYGAVNYHFDEMKKFKPVSLYIAYDCIEDKKLEYDWSKEISAPCVISLSQLTGLHFRAFNRAGDDNCVDAIIKINVFSVMETVIKKLKELKIPHRVLLDEQKRACVIISDVFALFNLAILGNTQQYHPTSNLKNWKRVVSMQNKQYSGHHLRFFKLQPEEKEQEVSRFVNNLRENGFVCEVKQFKGSGGVLMDLTSSRIRK